MTRSSVVAVPELTFAALSRALSERGWRIESQSTEPIVPGEPEWAVFSHAPSSGAIHYTFNPVVSLRVLNHRGADEAVWREAVSQLPRLEAGRVRSLLGSGDKREILLGLFAAGELEQTGVLDQVLVLCDHPDARVSASAVRCRDGLLRAAMAQVRAVAGGPHAAGKLFTFIPLVEWRRQTLRWLARDQSESNRSIDQVICAALGDEDPEVRMTAVLTAAKLNARPLLDCVRRTRVPESTSDGADERHRLFYREVWRGAVRYLSTGYATMAFLGALNGSLEVKDDPTLLLHSLLTPVELGPKPEALPPGIEEHANGYRLTDSRALLRWVPPALYWLGEDRARYRENPVRAVHAAAGFFVWEQPIDGLRDCVEALRLCRDLSGQVDVKLPTADQWEMAARGTDGRRYPWGNMLTCDWRQCVSPCGARGMVGNAFEWTRAVDEDYILCGGPDPTPCAQRSSASPLDRAAVRPVIETGPGQ